AAGGLGTIRGKSADEAPGAGSAATSIRCARPGASFFQSGACAATNVGTSADAASTTAATASEKRLFGMVRPPLQQRFAWKAAIVAQRALLALVAEPLRDLRVGVRPPVAEERPADPARVDLGEIDLLDEHGLVIRGRARDDAAVRRRDEALAPELDAGRRAAAAARIGLEADAGHRDDEAAVRDRVAALDRLPRGVLALAEFRLLVRAPADRGRVGEDLGALERGEPRGLGVPLIPADEHTELRGRSVEHLEAEVAGREVELLVVPRVVRDVHLAVLAEVAAVRVEHRGRVVDHACGALPDQARDD